MKTLAIKIKLSLAILAAGVSGVLQADAQLRVDLLDAQYTTYVWVEGINGESGTSRTTVSPVPTSDLMFGPASGLVCARADAELYQGAALTFIGDIDGPAGVHHAWASAETRILFSPLNGGMANVSFDFFGKYLWFWSDGAVSLVDTTVDQTLWDNTWTWGGGPLWQNQNPDGTASGTLSFSTEFTMGHTYALDMFVRTGADEDAEQVSVQLSGIEVVPEPSAFAVVGLGLTVFLALRHRGGVRPKRYVVRQ